MPGVGAIVPVQLNIDVGNLLYLRSRGRRTVLIRKLERLAVNRKAVINTGKAATFRMARLDGSDKGEMMPLIASQIG